MSRLMLRLKISLAERSNAKLDNSRESPLVYSRESPLVYSRESPLVYSRESPPGPYGLGGDFFPHGELRVKSSHPRRCDECELTLQSIATASIKHRLMLQLLRLKRSVQVAKTRKR